MEAEEIHRLQSYSIIVEKTNQLKELANKGDCKLYLVFDESRFNHKKLLSKNRRHNYMNLLRKCFLILNYKNIENLGYNLQFKTGTAQIINISIPEKWRKKV